jgi:DNA modification methylase
LPYEDFKEIYNKTLLNLEIMPNLVNFYYLHAFERNNWNNTDTESNTFTNRGTYTPRTETPKIHTNPNCPCYMLDEQSGVKKSSKRTSKYNKDTEHTNTYTPAKSDYRDDNTYADKGGASRFFYCPKAAKSDRNEGLDEFEKKGNKFMATKNGTGETSKGMERFTTEPKANHHPTVKPTDLMRYLINLVTPPNGTILDPFMGSGSTGKAAVRCGVNFIGIEKEQEYMDIASARIEHEKNKPVQTKLFDGKE